MQFGLAIFGLFALSGFRVVRPLEKGLVERFGKFNRVSDAGLTYIIPIVDHIFKINLTENMMDIKPQEVITKDNLNAQVDLVVYYKVKRDDDSVKKSVYNVDKFEKQIISLAQTTARNVIGTMPFVDVNSKRGTLNEALADVLDKESDEWGVEIVRVEMKEIKPPADVQDVMNKVLKAENEKISSRDYALAREIEADGIKKATIKEAEGLARSITLKATADAQAIKDVSQASEKFFKKRAEVRKRLEVIQNTLGEGTKWVLNSNNGVLPILDLNDASKKLKMKK